jgi:thiol peroxidase
VVNPEGKMTYVEYVKEIAEHPNYDATLSAAKG